LSSEGLLGLYVHIPFCEARCSYCHFAIDPRRPDDERQERYLRAVLSEMAQAEGATADTLYLGGGTPSLMEPERIGRLVDEARRRFGLSPGAEVTVEANPGDLDRQGLGHLRTLGVNRISLGAQAFDDVVLRQMGRHHSSADSLAACRRARAAGFDNLSLDIILGWPGETRERWRSNLDTLLTLEPDHVSVYVLEVEGRTVLTHRQRRGQLELPDEDLVADLFQETIDRLGAAGIVRYEISNFAREGFASCHNRKYWDDAPFLGLGLSSHSYHRGRRWWNLDRYATYCQAVEEGRGAMAGERRLTALERAQEALFTGLRRVEGVDLETFERSHGIDVAARWTDPLGEIERAGLAEIAGGRLKLTERGMLLSNEVFQNFV
jgi:oxygen-independent coproporphyrinogen-3 oxidase